MMSAAPPASDHARNDVRMDGVYFFRSSITGAFSKSLDPGNYAYCIMIVAGRLRLETDFPFRMVHTLGPGDAVAISGLAPHAFRSLGVQAAAAADRFARREMGAGAGDGSVELVIGVAPNEAVALGSLMVGPIAIRRSEHRELSRRLWHAVEMLEDEYADASWIDRNLVIRRLAEVMLINVTRRVFAERARDASPPNERTSRHVILAINAFLRAPDRAWTLADLAKAAGMSRTRFVEEFKLVTGHTPARIIARMRLTAIARRLVNTPLNIEAAAEEAGYGSAAAFVRAFQREFGETPARWRRQNALRYEAVAPSHLAATGTRVSRAGHLNSREG